MCFALFDELRSVNLSKEAYAHLTLPVERILTKNPFLQN